MNLCLGATDEGSQLCVDVPRGVLYIRTSSLPESNTPPPFSSAILTYFPYSVHIINSVLTGSGFRAIGSSDLFTSVWIKACKCSIMKLPDVELCNADALIDAMEAIDV